MELEETEWYFCVNTRYLEVLVSRGVTVATCIYITLRIRFCLLAYLRKIPLVLQGHTHLATCNMGTLQKKVVCALLFLFPLMKATSSFTPVSEGQPLGKFRRGRSNFANSFGQTTPKTLHDLFIIGNWGPSDPRNGANFLRFLWLERWDSVWLTEAIWHAVERNLFPVQTKIATFWICCIPKKGKKPLQVCVGWGVGRGEEPDPSVHDNFSVRKV